MEVTAFLPLSGTPPDAMIACAAYIQAACCGLTADEMRGRLHRMASTVEITDEAIATLAEAIDRARRADAVAVSERGNATVQ